MWAAMQAQPPVVLRMPTTVGEQTITIYGKDSHFDGGTSINIEGKLTSVPAEIWLLNKFLKTLTLVGHDFSCLPGEIELLTNLTYLGLDKNKLTALPREIGRLSKLQTLTVANNELQDLPTEIGQLTDLKWLSVRYNKLKHLPGELGLLDGLCSLFTSGNPDLALTSAEFAQEKSSPSGPTNAELFATATRTGHAAPPIVALLKAEAAFIERTAAAKRETAKREANKAAKPAAEAAEAARAAQQKAEEAAKREAAEAVDALRREQSKSAAASTTDSLPATKIIRSAELSPPIGEARKLGEGGFGAVYAMKQHGRIDVAVKALHVSASDTSAMDKFKHEAALHASLADEHIVMFKGVVLDGPQLLIVMPLMLCSVWDAIHKAECAHHALVRQWAARAQICVEIALGLLYLHALTPAIVHRDLKSANVLLDRAGVAKLVDFGLAQTKQHASTNTSTKGAVGTVQWMAPEILDAMATKYSAAVDIYALGVTAWELAALKQPYEHAHSPMQIMFAVAQGKRPDIPADTPAAFRKAVEACWAQKAEDRPSASDAVALFEAAGKAPAAPAAAAGLLPPASSRRLPPASSRLLPPASSRLLPPASSRLLPPASSRLLPPASARPVPPARQQKP